MARTFKIFGAVMLLLFGMIGCDVLQGPSGDAASLLPDLAGYHTVEGESFTDALTTIGVLATLAGQPELGAPIATVSGVVSCYQEAGAVKARVYSDENEPRNSGVIAVGDRNALLNPLTFLQCVPGNSGRAPESITIEPCSHSYTLSRDGNEFYILYAGLTPDVCHIFCTNLEACTAH